MKSYWITYKGKRIFFGRYDKMTLDEARLEVGAVDKEMQQQPPASVLLLIETAGTLMSPEALNLFKNHAKNNNKYVTKTAVLGMGGPRGIIMDIIARFSGINVAGFNDEEKAKEWLIAGS